MSLENETPKIEIPVKMIEAPEGLNIQVRHEIGKAAVEQVLKPGESIVTSGPLDPSRAIGYPSRDVRRNKY